MKEKGKSPWLAPSCASLKPRLYQIGVTEFSGEPEELNIAVLAGCFAGELYNRVSSRPAAARKIAWELKKLLDQKKTERAALYLLLRYRMAGLDIPDLLLWAMANQEVSRQFLGHFLNQYRELVKGGVSCNRNSGSSSPAGRRMRNGKGEGGGIVTTALLYLLSA